MDKLLRWFIVGDKANIYLDWFVSTFSSEDFNNLDKLMYVFLQYCTNLGLVPKRRFLEVFMATEGKQVIKEYKITVDTLENFDYKDARALEEAYRIIANSIVVQIGRAHV